MSSATAVTYTNQPRLSIVHFSSLLSYRYPLADHRLPATLDSVTDTRIFHDSRDGPRSRYAYVQKRHNGPILYPHSIRPMGSERITKAPQTRG
jgi:hypothetical protein